MRRRAIWLIAVLPILAPLAAAALATLTATPATVDFARRCVRSPSDPRAVRVTNQGNPEAVDVRVEISPSSAGRVFPLSGRTAVPSLDPGEDFSFRVGFVPEIAGTARARAVIRYSAVVPAPSPTKTQGGPKESESPSPSPTPEPSPSKTPRRTSVALTGSATDRWVDTSPHFLNFGALRVRKRAPAQTVTVYDDGDTPLRVSGISLAGRHPGDYTIDERGPLTVTDGNPLTIEVGFRPRAAGARTAVLVIQSDSCSGPLLEVPLAGIGVLPDIIALPQEIDFGRVSLTAVKRDFLDVINQGGLDLQVNEIEVTGEDAEAFVVKRLPRLPRKLKPGESLELRVTFTPEEPGPAEAVVEITSNDPDTKVFEVPLKAEVVAPASPSPSPTVSAAPAPPPSDGGLGIDLAAYLPEVAVATAVVGFFVLLTVVRRVRGIPE